jgi:phosphoketolase
LPGFEKLGKEPAIAQGQNAIAQPNDEKAVFQTMLAADALRYLILQVTASKSSGHPGGFASQASVCCLGHAGLQKHLDRSRTSCSRLLQRHVLDRSLEDMGIETVQQVCDRFGNNTGF